MPTLPNNPFENLFGGETEKNQVIKQPAIKTNIPANPFEGLFEAKKETVTPPQQVQSQQIQQKEQEKKPGYLGFPETYISTAQPKEPKKETSLTKAVKALLPRSLEIKFGLTEPNISEQIMINEDARQAYYREKEFNEVLKKEGVDLNSPPALPEEYKEPTGFWGSLVEGVKFAFSTTIKPAIGYLVESIGTELGNPGWRKWGQEFGDKQIANVLKHPELFAPKEMKGFFEGGWTDPRYYGRKIGEAVPFVAVVIGATTAAALTKNPALVKATAFGSTMAIEKANAYKDMIDRGISPDKAAPASGLYGAISSVIENSIGFRPAQIVLGESGTKIVTNSFKEFLKKELPKYSVEFLSKVAQEGGEEGAQQLAQNLVTKWLDNSQGIWEGVAESIPAGAIGALPFGATDVISSLTKYNLSQKQAMLPENQTSENIQKIVDEKLNLDFQYELKKENVFKIQQAENQPNLAEINVAEIGDGKWVFDYEANTADMSLSSDYISNGIMNSRAEAINTAKTKILEWAESSLDSASNITKSQLQNIIAETKKVNPELEVPVEVKQKEKLTEEKIEEVKAEEVEKEEKAVEEIKEKPTEEVKPIPKELEPLAEEVRKYKSAEEFFNKLTSPEGIEIGNKRYYRLDIPNLTNPELPASFEDVVSFYNQATKETKPEKEVRGEKEPETKEKISTPKETEETPLGKITKVAKSIETKAIERGIIKQFEGLAEYEPITIKNQIKLISELMASDIEAAKRMVAGEIPVQKGIKGAMLVKMMEDYALENKDANLILKIAQSPLLSETSEAGQTLRLLAEREPDSATAKIQELKKIREEAAEKRRRGKTRKQIESEMRKELDQKIKQKRIHKASWESLLKEITC